MMEPNEDGSYDKNPGHHFDTDWGVQKRLFADLDSEDDEPLKGDLLINKDELESVDGIIAFLIIVVIVISCVGGWTVWLNFGYGILVLIGWAVAIVTGIWTLL